jgi:hypothetical protein
MAVVSQPFDRAACLTSPGQIDEKLGEFWERNPWDIANTHNLSAFERKRTWMNLKGKNFIDLSFLTGTDNDGDGRSVVGCDFSNNGRQDLIVRQSGGGPASGPLLLYENNFPQRRYLKVSLRSKKGNRLGIGARLTAEVGGQKIVRELYPINSFHSQGPTHVHFGLGNAKRVDKLTIRWPFEDKVQVLTDIDADQHIIVDKEKEGPAAIEKIEPGRVYLP